MSEVVEGGMTAGGLLREARQAAGMHIAALAVALKVPVSKLEALEADNHDALPDTVFVRALASSVCRTLKIDAGPVLALLPQSQSPRLSTDSAGLNAPLKSSAGKVSSSSSSAAFSSSASRPMAVIVAVLLVGALAVFFFPRQQGAASSPVALLESPPPAAAAPLVPAAPAEAAQHKDEAPAETNVSMAVAPMPPQPAVPASGAVASVAPAPAAVASQAPASSAAASSGVLVLRARSQSWVQVRDAAGTVVLQRNLAAEESVSVGAPAPLSVVIGRADATEVFVRGKPFDLAAVSRENVARFEVK